MTFKILWAYSDLLELYGDSGNIKVLKNILEYNNIEYIIDEFSIDDNVNFKDYDLIFLGGGSDLNQEILSFDLLSRKNQFIEAMNNKTFILTICGGYQMFGKYYLDSYGNKIKCLDIFNYYTESSSKRSVGNIKIKPNPKFKFPVLEENERFVGFENHGGQTKGIDEVNCLGEVICGNGNNHEDKYEGYVDDFFIGTYLHGSLLPKNPTIAKYIIEKVLLEKHNIKKEIKLNHINDVLTAKKEVIF